MKYWKSYKPALIFIFVLVAVLLVMADSISELDQDIKATPNVVIILADDAGYADFGFMGSRDIKTPNLDKLAADGTIFTDAYVSASVCSPSRAGLLTGRYQQRFGHECNLEPDQPGAFDSAQVTIAEYLQTQGYHTSIFGKWHLGEESHQHPLRNGFDYFWGFLAGGRSYFPDKKQDEEGSVHAILENHNPSGFEGYLTDAIGARAVEYLDRRSGEKPFFMYLSFNAPHTPMHAKEEVIAAFGEDHPRPVYAAMLWSMDEAVGQVISELKRKGLYENTLIFFLSDNGGAHNNQSSVAPFKGWKGNQFEGGTRVPFTVTWKNKLPSGKRFSGLSSSLDIYGTVASLIGSKPKTDLALDGTDLIPYILAQKRGDPHTELYWRKDEMASIRVNDYKYITLRDSLAVMYNLKEDPKEMNDVKKSEHARAKHMQSSLNEWSSELDSPIWLEPEQWNMVTRRIYKDLMTNNKPKVKDPGDLTTNQVVR